MNKLPEFINSERRRFADKYNNIFAFSFGQILYNYQYLSVIHQRYDEESREFLNIVKTQQALMKPGTRPVTDEGMKLLVKSHELSTKLHLDIESFYLFAKILLDKSALAIEFYFGQARGLTLASHHKLIKNIASFSKAKNLNLNEALLNIAIKLQGDVSDLRDDQIAHVPSERNTRLTRSIMWDGKGNTKLVLDPIYPTEKDKHIETRLMQELIADIDKYLDEIIDFVRNNGSKTVLPLEEVK